MAVVLHRASNVIMDLWSLSSQISLKSQHEGRKNLGCPFALTLYAQLFSIRFYVSQDSIRSLDGVFFDIQYTAG